jgi:hypothetical protein
VIQQATIVTNDAEWFWGRWNLGLISCLKRLFNAPIWCPVAAPRHPNTFSGIRTTVSNTHEHSHDFQNSSNVHNWRCILRFFICLITNLLLPNPSQFIGYNHLTLRSFINYSVERMLLNKRIMGQWLRNIEGRYRELFQEIIQQLDGGTEQNNIKKTYPGFEPTRNSGYDGGTICTTFSVPCVTFRITFFFYGEEVGSCVSKPQYGGSQLVGCSRMLIHINKTWHPMKTLPLFLQRLLS